MHTLILQGKRVFRVIYSHEVRGWTARSSASASEVEVEGRLRSASRWELRRRMRRAMVTDSFLRHRSRTLSPLDNPLPEWAAHAIAAAERGAAVFPLLTKHTIPVKWGREATSSLNKILEWVVAFPKATGYGIALREDQYVFDADSPAAVEWCRNNMPLTYEVSTGRDLGGVHFYYHVPNGRRLRMLNTKLGELFDVPGLDGKTKGGYVVGPGSVHATGRRYTVAADRPLAPLSPFVVNTIGDRKQLADDGADAGLTPEEIAEFAANATWGKGLANEAVADASVIKNRLVAYLRVTDERWSDAFLEASIALGIHVATGAISHEEAVQFMERIVDEEDQWGTPGNVHRSIRRGLAYGARQEKMAWL